MANTSATFTGGTTFTGANATLGGGAQLYWNQDGTLIGKAFALGAGGSYGYVNVGSGNTLTLDGTSSFSGVFDVNGTTGATIVNQGAITASSGTSYLFAPTLTNQGTITANSGASLYAGYIYALTNASNGSVTASGANSVVYLNSVINQGTVNADGGGQLVFQGSTTTANLGNVILSGGRALLGGTLDNNGATLGAPTGGTFELYAGTIQNGTIGSGALTFTSSGGTLNNVSYTGDLNVAANTLVTFAGGTTFTGANATLGGGAQLYWNQDFTLIGKTFTLGAGGSYGYINVGSGNTLTIDGTSSFSGVFDINGTTGATIINQGAITANSGTSYLYAPTLVNQGTITATNGASLYAGYVNALTNASNGTVIADGANSVVYLNSVINQGTLKAQGGGQLDFQGSTTTANLGNVILSGGRALLGGTVDNSGATLGAPTGGTFELYAGTIQNGTIGSGALSFTSSGGTLNNVSYTGDLNVAANTLVTFAGGTTFTGANATLGGGAQLYWNQNNVLIGKTFTLGAGGSYGYLNVGNGNTLTLDGTSSVSGVFDVNGTTGATIVNQGAITASSGTSYLFAPTLTNQGTITANSGASLYAGYIYALTNASNGSVTASGANSVVYLYSVINQGTLNADGGGQLVFQGSTTTANLGTVVLSGGRALLGGTLENSGAALGAPTGGTFELYAGTIQNGTIAPGALSFTSSGGTLNNVSYTGDLNVAANTLVTFAGGTTFTGANGTLGGGAQLYWNQNNVLIGKTFTLGAGGSYGYVNVGSGNTLTLDGTSSFSGVFDVNGTTGATIINQGAITANSGTSYLYAPTLTNQGTITANSGASLYAGYVYALTNASNGSVTASGTNSVVYLNSINNQGTLNAQSGGQLVFQGSTTTANLGNVVLSGGRALLNGTLDNSGATLGAPTGGSFELYGGTIQNGTIAPGALSFTSSGGVLNNVSYTGDLNVAANTLVAFTGGSTFTGANATLGNSAGLYWQEAATLAGKAIAMGTGAYLYVSGVGNTLTFDSASNVTGDVTIYTDGSAGTAITNQGSITQNTGGGTMYGQSFTNAGTITVTAGSLNIGTSSPGFSFANNAGASVVVNGGSIFLQAPAGSPIINQGTINVMNGTLGTTSSLTNGATGLITGAGIISGSLTLAGGTLAPGNSVGTLTISGGNLVVSSASTFSVEISGATADQLLFQGPPSDIDIGAGLLSLSLTLLSAPTPGTTFTIMRIASGPKIFTGTFAGLPNSGDSLIAMFAGTPYTFNVSYLSNAIILAVPEPGVFALMGLGLAVVIGRRRFFRGGR